VVADSSNHRIQVFDEKGGFIRAFGSSGSGDGQLSGPYDVVVDLQGNYFVADDSNHRVSVFNSDGQFLRNFGSSGNGNGQLSNPYGIGLMSNGNVVVGEYCNSCVSIFDSQSNFIRHICAGQLSQPYHLFVDSNDNILVVNNTANPIRVFKADGTLVKNISIAGHAGGVGICMDPEGRIVACVCLSSFISPAEKKGGTKKERRSEHIGKRLGDDPDEEGAPAWEDEGANDVPEGAKHHTLDQEHGTGLRLLDESFGSILAL